MAYLNPLLKLPSARKILDLPDSPEKRLLEQLLRELGAEAEELAQKCWRTRKAPLAAYWFAAAVYCRHTARVFSRVAAAARHAIGVATTPASGSTDRPASLRAAQLEEECEA